MSTENNTNYFTYESFGSLGPELDSTTFKKHPSTYAMFGELNDDYVNQLMAVERTYKSGNWPQRKFASRKIDNLEHKAQFLRDAQDALQRGHVMPELIGFVENKIGELFLKNPQDLPSESAYPVFSKILSYMKVHYELTGKEIADEFLDNSFGHENWDFIDSEIK